MDILTIYALFVLNPGTLSPQGGDYTTENVKRCVVHVLGHVDPTPYTREQQMFIVSQVVDRCKELLEEVKGV